MRLAVLADIHGNLLALDAVLADLARRGGAEAVVNLGDSVSGPLWPRETLVRIQAAGLVTLRGNHDRWVAEGTGGASDAFARARLDPAQVAWLGRLPDRLAPLPGIAAFHARPDDDNAYLLEEVADGRMVAAAPAVVAARLGAVAAPLVLTAHSHLPRLLRLEDRQVVLNPGSVGCPAYADPTPPAHVSEAGSPFARYAMVEVAADGALRGAEMLVVPYDHAAAADRAAEEGRADWAAALRTGRMPAGAAV